MYTVLHLSDQNTDWDKCWSSTWIQVNGSLTPTLNQLPLLSVIFLVDFTCTCVPHSGHPLALLILSITFEINMSVLLFLQHWDLGQSWVETGRVLETKVVFMACHQWIWGRKKKSVTRNHFEVLKNYLKKDSLFLKHGLEWKTSGLGVRRHGI